MVFHLLAVVLVVAASVLAVLSTERAQPRLNGRIGWPLSVCLMFLAAVSLARDMGAAEACAVMLVYLMAGIPAMSLLMALRNRHARRPSNGR